MINKELLARLEALLFVHGEPMKIEKIKKALSISEEDFPDLISNFQSEIAEGNRGLSLLVSGDSVQLVTKAEFGDVLQAFIREELSEELSPASLETLSIIAYGGPISRAKLEYIRGVNSSFTLRALKMRGLVERVDSGSGMAHTSHYDVTSDCMRYLSVSRREDLPKYAEYKSLLESAEQSLSGTELAPQTS